MVCTKNGAIQRYARTPPEPVAAGGAGSTVLQMKEIGTCFTLNSLNYARTRSFNQTVRLLGALLDGGPGYATIAQHMCECERVSRDHHVYAWMAS